MSIKKLWYDALVYRKYRTLKPQSVVLKASGNKVYINPEDGRAFKKLAVDTSRGRESLPMQFWRNHNEAHPEAIMMDVGANYGECSFNANYPSGQDILVEANPGLIPYLQQSIDAHGDAERISLVNCLVASECGEAVEFHYSPDWTGSGAAIKDDKHTHSAKVRQRSLDDILAEKNQRPTAESTLVFKMDIEGFEHEAFKGFSCLESFAGFVGILEFSSIYLRRSGSSAESFCTHLLNRAKVFVVEKGRKKLNRISSWEDLPRNASDEIHCDLVITSAPDLIASGWL
ncbi:MAG: FkbM family methyltransferase [Pseudomonadales bacterium]